MDERMSNKHINIDVLSLNMNFYDKNGGHKSPRTFGDVMKELGDSHTFIALQEFGRMSYSHDLDGEKIEQALAKIGYGTLSPHKDGIFPVNVRLFYKRTDDIQLLNMETISSQYPNRHIGARFLVAGREVLVHSVYLPLSSKDLKGKRTYWQDILAYTTNSNVPLILAGDLNDSYLRKDNTQCIADIRTLNTLLKDNGGDATYKTKRLDHIFSDLPVISSETRPANFISDHRTSRVKYQLI